jgi:hypothetical protein
MTQSRFLLGALSALAFVCGSARAQIIGAYDNFDCFNDTGQEAEGFEIDIEDVSCDDNTEGSATCALTRVFPSNFGSTPWVIRYGLPTITHYDFTTATADPAHAYDQGHKGVLVTYAATWNGASWVASQGNAAGAPGPAGNGTPYNANPTLTAGDSCWWYGLAASYPTSGCDHFGVSFATGATPGKITYHWKLPDPVNTGKLVNAAAEASIPPSPTFSYAGAGQPVVAVARAPENPEPQWGPAYFVKTTTIYQSQAPVLANLQKVNLQNLKTRKYVTYSVLQQPPAGQVGEKDDVENDNVPPKDVQVTKQYEYWTYAGLKDDTGQALCDDAYSSVANYNAGIPIASGDSCTLGGAFYEVDVNGNLVHVKTNKGKYLGAHINAAQVH